MDWKKENHRNRYIDDMNWDEAKIIASLAAGNPDEFELKKLDRKVLPNGYPIAYLHYRYYEIHTGEREVGYVAINNNLDVWSGDSFKSVYSQKEIFAALKQMGFE